MEAMPPHRPSTWTRPAGPRQLRHRVRSPSQRPPHVTVLSGPPRSTRLLLQPHWFASQSSQQKRAKVQVCGATRVVT